MPAKTADQWLESSSEDDAPPPRTAAGAARATPAALPAAGAPAPLAAAPSASSAVTSTLDGPLLGSPPVTPTTVLAPTAAPAGSPATAAMAGAAATGAGPTPAELRRQQQEALRERMKAALGDRFQEPDPPPPPPASQDAAVGGAATPASAAASAPLASMEAQGLAPSGISAPVSGLGSAPSGALSPPPDEVVLMVADRGTQTAAEVSVQTDPEPHVGSCPECYERYYKRPWPTHPCGMPLSGPPGAAGMGPHAQAAAIGGHGFVPLHPATATAVQATRMAPAPVGGAGYWPAVGGGAHVPVATAAAPVAAWHMQLDTIRQQIDALVTKHNLPALSL